MPVLWPPPPFALFRCSSSIYNKKYYIDTILRYPYRRSYMLHGVIEDCATEEIFMRHDILKDMNISFAAYIDNNLAMI